MQIFFGILDIRDGQLKSILGLFFSLSRYKQQQKSLSKLQNGSSSLPQSTAAAATTATATATEMLSKYGVASDFIISMMLCCFGSL